MPAHAPKVSCSKSHFTVTKLVPDTGKRHLAAASTTPAAPHPGNWRMNIEHYCENPWVHKFTLQKEKGQLDRKMPSASFQMLTQEHLISNPDIHLETKLEQKVVSNSPIYRGRDELQLMPVHSIGNVS